MVLSSDFRQTLSPIPRSTYADEINDFLKSSTLWSNVEKFVQMLQDPSAWNLFKSTLRYWWLKSCYRWNWIRTINYQFLHNRWFARYSHWTNICRCSHTVHKSCLVSEKAILAAKNVNVDNLNLKIQRCQGTWYRINLLIQFATAAKHLIIPQSFWAHWICQACHRIIII